MFHLFDNHPRSHCLTFLSLVLQSAVMSAAFAKFHPNVIVGGTYSGQIVLWDNRSNKRTPVQRTPLSAAAHTVLRTPHAGGLTGFIFNIVAENKFTFTAFAAPGVLCEHSRHAERPQPDQHLNGRQDLLLEPGYALPAAGEKNSVLCPDREALIRARWLFMLIQ